MDLSNLKIGLHQDIITTGDIDGNLDNIKIGILEDVEREVDLSIFPETAITGYMCGSLWDREDFVVKQAKAIKELELFLRENKFKGTVIIGFVNHLGTKTNGFPRLRNAVAVISSKEIKIYEKQLLASADHHEDRKYFEPGDETKVFEVDLPNCGRIRIGIPICEDVWNTDHSRNIPEEMVVDRGADLLININQSYFYYGKNKKRYNLLSKISKNLQVPIISVNSLGVGDILKNIVIFAGGSFIFNKKGELLHQAPRLNSFHFHVEYGKLNPIEFRDFSKYEEITQAIIFEQKEFFRVCGLEKAQVHVSGGLDSAIVAALVNVSMGGDNTILITNPSKINEASDSLDYVNYIGTVLGNEVLENPIQSIFEEFMSIHASSFDWKELSKTGQATVQATLRTVQGLAASHQFGTGIVATGNHTEIVLGWASFHDIGSIGVHAILGDLTKTELFQLAEYLNEEFFEAEVIPHQLYDGGFKPAAELPDAMEDPINYPLQSGICALLIRERMSRNVLIAAFNTNQKKILNKDLFPDQSFLWSHSLDQWEKEVDFAIKAMKRSVYKAAQGAPIVIMSPRSRGFSNRETLINHYTE